MGDYKEIDILKAEIETLKEKLSDLRLDFLNFKRDIGSKVRHHKEDAASVSAATGQRLVEFRERITALETAAFKGMKFEEIERIIGKAGDQQPPKAS